MLTKQLASHNPAAAHLSRRAFVATTALGLSMAAGVATALAADQESVASSQVPQEWDGEYDVVVCGAGGAGLTAAYAALEKGASVLVLEKADACGGTTALSEGAIQASGTTWQASLGKVNVEGDDVDRHYAYWIGATEGLADAELVRAITANAADNVNYLAENFGIDYSMVFGCPPVPYTDEANSADRIHIMVDAQDPSKAGGVVWTDNALAAVEQAGGEVVLGCEVTGVVMDGENGAVGVTCADGRCYRARGGVVLAMAGIDHNEVLAKSYIQQQYWDLKSQSVVTCPTDTGDGIAMGLAAGADVTFTGCIDLLLPTWSYERNTYDEVPYILVNQRGVRFEREDTTYAFHCRGIFNACMQEGGFDADTCEGGQVFMVMDNKMTGNAQASWSDEDTRAAALESGELVQAESVAGLAEALGVDPKALARTVERWNGDVADGADLDFGREKQLTAIDEPPFYAWKVVNTNIGSIGGLKIDTSSQVVDRAGEPIAHLYAAGANAGGYLGPYYPGSGIMLQSACHTGRTAGYAAAATAGAQA